MWELYTPRRRHCIDEILITPTLTPTQSPTPAGSSTPVPETESPAPGTETPAPAPGTASPDGATFDPGHTPSRDDPTATSLPTASPAPTVSPTLSPSPTHIYASDTVVAQYPAPGTELMANETVNLFFYDVDKITPRKKMYLEFPSDQITGNACSVRIEAVMTDGNQTAEVVHLAPNVSADQFPLEYEIPMSLNQAPTKVYIYIGEVGGDTKLYKSHQRIMNDGIILKGVGGLYHVWVPDCACVYRCGARGIFRKELRKPLIGDAVSIDERNDAQKTAAIAEIAPRRNELRRPAVANVDQLLFAAASANPKPDLLLLDKMIVMAERKNIEFILLISKSDQDPDAAESIFAQYAPAVKCFITSARDRESFLPVMEALDGLRTVVAGQSGAGKSTFINTIAGRRLRIRAVSAKNGARTPHHTAFRAFYGNGWLSEAYFFDRFSRLQHAGIR